MIDASYLIANLDEVLGDNMFLKDARKAENLKEVLILFSPKLIQDLMKLNINYYSQQIKPFQIWKSLLRQKML